MAFTDDPWVHVEALIDGDWVDLSEDFDDEDGGGRISGTEMVSITRGKSAGAQRANPSQCNFTLYNRDGKYSNRNPRSPYFGLLPINTPVRVKTDPYESFVEVYSDTLGKALYAPDSATLDFTGDMEIRVEYEREHTLANGYPLISKYRTSGNNRSWMFYVTNLGIPQFYWSPDGTLASRRVLTGTEAVPEGRFALRVTLDVNNGAGGVDVRFYTSDSIGGTYTQLGATITSAGTSSVYAGTSDVVIGAADEGGFGVGGLDTRFFAGRIYAVRLYNNLSSSVTVNADFTNLEIGDTSADDGLTFWTITPPCRVASDSIRFYGFIPKWPISSPNSRQSIQSKLTAYGLTQRLSSGAVELDSAMRRYYSSIPNITGYWPGEDGPNATEIASTTPQTRAIFVRDVEFANEDSLPGSRPLLTLTETSRIQGRFRGHTDTGEWAFCFTFFIDTTPAADLPSLVTVSTTTGNTLRFTVGTLTYRTEIFNADGTLLSSQDTTFGAGAAPGQWITLVFELEQNGANVDWVTNWRTEDPGIGYAHGGTAAGITLGKMASWTVNGVPAAASVNTVAIGHIAGLNNVDVFLENAHINSFRAYNGETDVARLTRLCGEEGIDFYVRGKSAVGVAMGPQEPRTILDLIDECVEAGRGILIERRDSPTLEYVTQRELGLYVTEEVDYSGGYLLDAEVDDQVSPVNFVTVTRDGGGSSTVVVDSGPNSVDNIGRLGESYTLKVQEDDQTRDIAAWIARQGTWDESRWLKMEFELAKDGLKDDTDALRLFRKMDLTRAFLVTNPPDWLPIREPEVMIEEYKEMLSRVSHFLSFDTMPARPHKALSFVDNTIRIGSSSSTLTSGINDSVTSFSVSTSHIYGRWAYSDDFYISVSDDKEKMLVTNITGTSSPFTFTVTRGTPSFSHSAGGSVRLWDQRPLGYGN